AVTKTLPVFIFGSIAAAFVGILVGVIELVWLEKRFSSYSLGSKILWKLLIFMTFILVIILILYPIAVSIELSVPMTDALVWQKLGTYLSSIGFANDISQLSFRLLLSVLYAGISENLGPGVLRNLLTGKYHQPKREVRIFMFLDMKSSTTIAEQLGHVKYFSLLQQYYDEMSDAIINNEGEVYQYIGDEVVVSWKLANGLKNGNCLRTFFTIREAMRAKQSSFKDQFGVFPEFKAGMHYGEITVGEVGALKREIVFTGDVLNTTARIQGLCKKHNADLIITSDLKNQLATSDTYQFKDLGFAKLEGRLQEQQIIEVTKG
ncbi:MAG: adenylate/guanylate cyclase domain-containing protein, partial [Bacteroidota bacterium]